MVGSIGGVEQREVCAWRARAECPGTVRRAFTEDPESDLLRPPLTSPRPGQARGLVRNVVGFRFLTVVSWALPWESWRRNRNYCNMMTANDLRPGVIVRGPLFPEAIELLVVTPLGDVIKVVGAGQKTGQVHQRVLRMDQLPLLDATPEEAPFDGDPTRFRLGIEAARLGLAYEYDPYFSLSISRVDPLPHQLEAVYDYFMRLPRIRFLLADDPGAGKTIMAGLLLKELKIRGLVKRTLVVAPANLCFQWQRELKDKFRESFEVIRSDVLRANYGQNPWQEKDQVVTSISWVSRIEDANESLLRTIARGVETGMLGYVGKAADGSYSPFHWNDSLAPQDVEISQDVFLIQRDVAEAYAAPNAGVTTGGGGGSPGTSGTAPVLPGTGATTTSPGTQPATGATGNIPRLVWSGDIPHQKWMNFYTRVLSKFAAEAGLKLTLRVEAAPAEGVSAQKVDDTRVALRELGLKDSLDGE